LPAPLLLVCLSRFCGSRLVSLGFAPVYIASPHATHIAYAQHSIRYAAVNSPPCGLVCWLRLSRHALFCGSLVWRIWFAPAAAWRGNIWLAAQRSSGRRAYGSKCVAWRRVMAAATRFKTNIVGALSRQRQVSATCGGTRGGRPTPALATRHQRRLRSAADLRSACWLAVVRRVGGRARRFLLAW